MKQKFLSKRNSVSALTHTVLCVGTLKDWSGPLGRALPATETEFALYEELTEPLLISLRPSVILSPLFSNTCDSFELLARLEAFGFSGQYSAVTEKVPEPKLILSEMRSLAPSIKIELVEVDPMTNYLH